MPRFVVLRHEPAADSPRGLHWDLMLETGGVLRTWALPDAPTAGAVMQAERLDDHRLAYLEYEGPISGGRGQVARWDAGQFEAIEQQPAACIVRLDGQRFQGEVRLTAAASDAQRWTVSFSP